MDKVTGILSIGACVLGAHFVIQSCKQRALNDTSEDGQRKLLVLQKNFQMSTLVAIALFIVHLYLLKTKKLPAGSAAFDNDVYDYYKIDDSKLESLQPTLDIDALNDAGAPPAFSETLQQPAVDGDTHVITQELDKAVEKLNEIQSSSEYLHQFI
jgi:hypothetical protein